MQPESQNRSKVFLHSAHAADLAIAYCLGASKVSVSGSELCLSGQIFYQISLSL